MGALSSMLRKQRGGYKGRKVPGDVSARRLKAASADRKVATSRDPDDPRKIQLGGNRVAKRTGTKALGPDTGTLTPGGAQFKPFAAQAPSPGGDYAVDKGYVQAQGSPQSTAQPIATTGTVDRSVRSTTPVHGSGLVTSSDSGFRARASGLSDILRTASTRRKSRRY